MISIERRNLTFVSLLGFLVSMGFGLIVPIMPFYVEILGGNAFQLGILLSSFMVTRAIFARYFGRLSDAIGRKRIIVVGAVLYAVLGIMFTFPGHWTGLILVRGLQGVASAMVWPVGEALIVDSAPEDRRGFAISIYMVTSNVGFAAGPFAGGLLLWTARNPLGMGDLASFHFPFYFIAIFSGIAALLVQSFVTDIVKPGVERGAANPAETPPPQLPRSMRKQVNILFLNNLGNGFSFSLIGFLPIYYMKDFLGLNEVVAGTVIGAAMIVGLGVNLPSGYISDRIGRKPLVVFGSYMARGSSVLIPFSASVYQLASLMVFRSFAFQMSQPALRALQADLFPPRIRGKLIGTSQALFNVGAVFGAPLGGFLYDALRGIESLGSIPLPGVALPFLVSSILGIITTSLILLYVRETRKKVGKEPGLPTEL
ncbi:MAG: MFS transporter [Candidatus Thermoplasmatota archaeon]|nr:MFS transporter [Candidatus Thermoplasmatota archaeon]